MKGLSAAQQYVIDRMNDGWELGADRTMHGRCWIQKGGIGHGGEAETISISTFQALQQRGIVRSKGHDFPTERFELVSA